MHLSFFLKAETENQSSKVFWKMFTVDYCYARFKTSGFRRTLDFDFEGSYQTDESNLSFAPLN